MNVLQHLWSRVFGSSRSARPSQQRTRLVLDVEPLNERIVPAGNVTGVVQNGNLILTGDGEDNLIEVRKGIGGLRILGVSGTTINGAGGLEDFSGVFKDVIINLNGGDDVVNLEGGGGGTAAVVSRDLIFSGGGGVDTLTSEAGAVIGRDLIFNGGAGAAATTLDGIIIGRNAMFAGNEDVHVESLNNTTINGVLKVQSLALTELVLDDTTLGGLNVSATEQADVELTNVLVGGKARILGGSGDDLIEMSFGTQILGNLTINTQGGNDSVDPDAEVGGNVAIRLGTGINQDLDIFNMTVYGNLTIISEGSAADNWTLDGLEVVGDTTLSSGEGADTVLFNDAEFHGATTFQGGGGSDQVQISDGSHVYFRGTTLFDLGNGADTLQLGAGGIGTAHFDYLVTLQGGNGADTLDDVNSDFDEVPTILSF